MRTIIFTVCLVLAHIPLCAQVVIEALPRWHASAHIIFMNPGEPINKFLDSGQLGYQFEFQYRVQYNKPFLAGGYYGESTLSKYVLTYSQSSGNGVIDIREKANTRRVETGITAGFYPEINWLLQPYLQGRAGVSIFQTSSILTNKDTNASIERISESTTAAPSYGMDIGLHIVPNIWYIRGDIRVGFVANTSTSYLLLNEMEAGETGFPIDYFETHTTSGKWFKISAGISYLF